MRSMAATPQNGDSMMRFRKPQDSASRWLSTLLIAVSAVSALSLGGCIVVRDRGYYGGDGYYEGHHRGDGYRYRERDHRDGYYR
jgi:hypothetical protein